MYSYHLATGSCDVTMILFLPYRSSSNCRSVSRTSCRRFCNPKSSRIKNLDVAFYRNGDLIPKVTDAAAWAALTTGAYCYYNNDSATYAATYGKLYNWYVLNDIRGLAPAGWHLPNAGELQSLTLCTTGGAVKQAGNTTWTSPNTGATNQTGFTALPGGSRNPQATFFDIGFFGSFWIPNEFNSTNGNFFLLSYNNSLLQALNYPKNNGLSVRCIKD